MSFTEQFVLNVYDQIKRMALAILPKLIERGWSVQQQLAVMGMISLVALVQVTFRMIVHAISFA